MFTYKIKRSDRTRARTVQAEEVKDAVRIAAGNLFYSSRLDDYAEDRSFSTWSVTLCAGKKDKTGGQPVVERTFYVFPIY